MQAHGSRHPVFFRCENKLQTLPVLTLRAQDRLTPSLISKRRPSPCPLQRPQHPDVDPGNRCIGQREETPFFTTRRFTVFSQIRTRPSGHEACTGHRGSGGGGLLWRARSLACNVGRDRSPTFLIRIF